MHLIQTLVFAFIIAFGLGFLAQKLKLSPIIGYLLAGVIVGPYTPNGMNADLEIAEQCAEIGVILLMFGVGLHFHFNDLIAVRKTALPGAIIQIAGATGLGILAALLLGWPWTVGAAMGTAISVASTVVLTRILSDNRVLHTPGGHIALGWLIVEDLFTILAIVLLPVLMSPDGANLWQTIGFTFLKLTGLFLIVLFVGQKIIPWVLTQVARTGTRELFTLAVLAIALGIAYGASELFGASMALGAFLAGMVVGQSEFSARAASEALPMRDAFAVLFFVSVGMLVNPTNILSNWQLILIMLAIVMLGKPIIAFLVVIALRKPIKLALIVSVALAQIGEFSFVMASMGEKYGLISEEVTAAIIITAVISITLNPFIYKRIPPLLKKIENSRLNQYLSHKKEENRIQPVHEDSQRLIVVGYGPVGRTLARILEDNHIEPVIIEMNIDTVRELRNNHKLVIHGDATNTEILRSAGIENACGLIISSMAIPAREVVDAARSIKPDIPVTMYSFYLRGIGSLRAIENSIVVSGEESAAVAMASHLLRQLGATEEQIDNERKRILNSLKENFSVQPD